MPLQYWNYCNTQAHSAYAWFYIVSNTCYLAPCSLNSEKVFLLLSYQYHNPEQGFEPGSFGGYNQLKDCMSSLTARPPWPVIFFALLAKKNFLTHFHYINIFFTSWFGLFTHVESNLIWLLQLFSNSWHFHCNTFTPQLSVSDHLEFLSSLRQHQLRMEHFITNKQNVSFTNAPLLME